MLDINDEEKYCFLIFKIDYNFRILLASAMVGLAAALGKQVPKDEDTLNYKIESDK